MTTEERFWSKVKIGADDECWLWTGAPNGSGYGYFSAVGGTVGAHRFALETKTGPLDPGRECLHGPRRCSSRLCCNPAHLREGTRAENVADRKLEPGYQEKLEAGEDRRRTSMKRITIKIQPGLARRARRDGLGRGIPDLTTYVNKVPEAVLVAVESKGVPEILLTRDDLGAVL